MANNQDHKKYEGLILSCGVAAEMARGFIAELSYYSMEQFKKYAVPPRGAFIFSMCYF